MKKPRKTHINFLKNNSSSDINNSERVTVIGSDLFDLDDDIKQYLLEHSDMSFATAVKIILRYYVTADVILQLNVFEDYLEKTNPFLFLEVFGKHKKDRKT